MPVLKTLKRRKLSFIMPIPVRALFSKSHDTEMREAPPLCLVPLCVTAAGCLAVTFVAGPIVRLLQPLVQ